MKKRELRQLGLELKQEREIRNINIEDIADKTKINIKFLKSIESGNFNFLPNTYVRYFLKAYLQQLGSGTSNYLTKYEEIVQSFEPPTITDKDLSNSNSKNNTSDSWALLIENIKRLKKRYLSIFAGGVILIILIVTIPSSKEKKENLAPNNVANTQLISNKESRLAGFSSFQFVNEELKLNLVAKELTWLQIAIDDSAAQEYIFKRGDSAVWSAKENFLLRIGNSGGVRLYLNGNDLGPIGKKLEVANFVLTKDGIQRKMF